MLLLLIAAAGLAPPPAERIAAPQPHHVSAAIRVGCRVQQVHTPRGKPVQSAPIVRCTPEQRALLAGRPPQRAAGSIAR
ncbi:hypothetical protein [Sphingomonas sp.]|uniref:hypothetical protein n=1 Tax=Sphingomonas sp. TaxID=28214 RepID=UPI002D0361D6|nr:hypothetical protein [Sphingomonas sp.]HWK35469.1 hypothetical protein [Sphingomonas sp.]